MSDTLVLIFAVIAAAAALATTAAVMATAIKWALTQLIRNEVNPLIEKVTNEFAEMRGAFEAGQLSQTTSNEELHDALGELRATMALIDERLGDVEVAQARLEERMAKAAGA